MFSVNQLFKLQVLLRSFVQLLTGKSTYPVQLFTENLFILCNYYCSWKFYLLELLLTVSCASATANRKICLSCATTFRSIYLFCATTFRSIYVHILCNCKSTCLVNLLVLWFYLSCKSTCLVNLLVLFYFQARLLYLCMTVSTYSYCTFVLYIFLKQKMLCRH